MWKLNLHTNDPYGTCAYELDGEPVSGTILVHESQKLTLEYTLDTESMQIQLPNSNWFKKKLQNKQHQKIEISVDTLANGADIRREDYLTVAEKEG